MTKSRYSLTHEKGEDSDAGLIYDIWDSVECPDEVVCVGEFHGGPAMADIIDDALNDAEHLREENQRYRKALEGLKDKLAEIASRDRISIFAEIELEGNINAALNPERESKE